MICTICLEKLPTNRQVNVCKLRCGHHFHDTCIQVWNLQNINCPICRVKIQCQHRHHRKHVYVKQNRFLLSDNIRLMTENTMLQDRITALSVQLAEMSAVYLIQSWIKPSFKCKRIRTILSKFVTIFKVMESRANDGQWGQMTKMPVKKVIMAE